MVTDGKRERLLEKGVPAEKLAVIPNGVDTDRFHPARRQPPQGPTLGWVGYSDNLPYLEGLAGPLAELTRRHPGLRLKVVADRPPRLEGIDVVFERWTLQTELPAFDGISVGLSAASSFDGIVSGWWRIGRWAYEPTSIEPADWRS